MTAKDIEPWLLPQPLAPKNKGEIIEFSSDAKSLILRSNDFASRDKELDAFTKELVQVITYRSGWEQMSKVLKSWLMEAVVLAKRENIQQTAWQKEEKIYNFYDLETSQIRQLLERLLEEANKDKFVQIRWEIVNDELKIEVKFNSKFTEYLYRRLFEDKYANEQEILEKANRLLQGILKVRLQLNNFQTAAAGFSADDNITSLWLKIPVSGINISETIPENIRLKTGDFNIDDLLK